MSVRLNLMDETFEALHMSGKKALIPFITVGDPDLNTSIEIICELEKAGADIIELGVPYSDPLADGPVIQRASERALKQHITIRTCMETAKRARAAGVKLPFVLFTYFNPVLQMGLDSFFDLLVEHDISGIIIPDLPIEESAQIREYADKANIHLIPLVAPTSKDRMKKIVSNARGFIYCVSSLGVTGERATFHQEVDEFISEVKSLTKLPVAVGFGISSREQVEHFSHICDGAVVGSAIVRVIENTIPLLTNPDTKEEGLMQIRQFVSQLKG